MIPALPNNSNNIRFNYFIRSDQTKPITVFYHFVRQTVLLIVLRNNSIPCRVSSTGSVGFIGSAKNIIPFNRFFASGFQQGRYSQNKIFTYPAIFIQTFNPGLSREYITF